MLLINIFPYYNYSPFFLNILKYNDLPQKYTIVFSNSKQINIDVPC